MELATSDLGVRVQLPEQACRLSSHVQGSRISGTFSGQGPRAVSAGPDVINTLLPGAHLLPLCPGGRMKRECGFGTWGLWDIPGAQRLKATSLGPRRCKAGEAGPGPSLLRGERVRTVGDRIP
ncbi:hypothetical protein H1C71_032644 [Ictidomys tridecemlineatus]|nr:hypothetical protein H1C71_032644 [Ictidomys tridecemlineatus]